MKIKAYSRIFQYEVGKCEPTIATESEVKK